MNTHSKSYYVIRAIVRFLFHMLVIGGSILMIHFIASMGLIASLVFGGLTMAVYFALGRASRRTSTQS